MDKKITLDDAMICPQCKGDNCYQYSADEVEFSYDGTGNYYVDCHCISCNKNFRLYTEFEYSITKNWTRG